MNTKKLFKAVKNQFETTGSNHFVIDAINKRNGSKCWVGCVVWKDKNNEICLNSVVSKNFDKNSKFVEDFNKFVETDIYKIVSYRQTIDTLNSLMGSSVELFRDNYMTFNSSEEAVKFLEVKANAA